MQEEKKQLLARVAYLYYIEGKTQNEIAKELNIYRTTISRMLKRAQAEGIVSIQIEGIDTELFSLERYVKEKYGLNYFELAAGNADDTAKEKEEQLGFAAAQLMKRVIEPGNVVGLSWGATLAQAISQTENKKVANTTFVPIVGGPSHLNSQFHVNTLVYELARKFHGNSIFVNATVIQESKKLKQGIMDSHYFKELKDCWQQLDVALVGIGGQLSHKKSQWRDLLNGEDYEELKLREAVGDCCCRFVDAEGKQLTGDLYDRTIGLELNELSSVPISIGIARGKPKAKAILALLKRHYINSLVTDRETILEVLKIDKDKTYSSAI